MCYTILVMMKCQASEFSQPKYELIKTIGFSQSVVNLFKYFTSDYLEEIPNIKIEVEAPKCNYDKSICYFVYDQNNNYQELNKIHYISINYQTLPKLKFLEEIIFAGKIKLILDNSPVRLKVNDKTIESIFNYLKVYNVKEYLDALKVLQTQDAFSFQSPKITFCWAETDTPYIAWNNKTMTYEIQLKKATFIGRFGDPITKRITIPGNVLETINFCKQRNINIIPRFCYDPQSILKRDFYIYINNNKSIQQDGIQLSNKSCELDLTDESLETLLSQKDAVKKIIPHNHLTIELTKHNYPRAIMIDNDLNWLGNDPALIKKLIDDNKQGLNKTIPFKDIYKTNNQLLPQINPESYEIVLETDQDPNLEMFQVEMNKEKVQMKIHPKTFLEKLNKILNASKNSRWWLKYKWPLMISGIFIVVIVIVIVSVVLFRKK